MSNQLSSGQVRQSETPASAERTQSSIMRRTRGLRESGLGKFARATVLAPEFSLVIAIAIFGAITTTRNDAFLTYSNLILVVKSAAPTFVVAITMTFVLIGGGIDLSVGSMAGLGGLVTAMALQDHLPIILAICLGIVVCGAVGAGIGVVITKFHIPALIVTLGGLYAIRGVVLILTNSQQVFPLPSAFDAIGQSSLGDIPSLVFIAIGFGIIGHLALSKFKFGYHIRAIGGNAAAARAVGIKVDRMRIVLYALSGVGAAIAGILTTSFVGDGDPSFGQGMELSVIAAVIVGGASLFGAVGSVPGTALGVLFLALITNGFLLMRISANWQFVVQGIVVVAAVGVDQIRRIRIRKLSAG
jgi:ribose/xylose/arabinose/galactoside ABC-type transport system permease subunit